MKPRTQKHSAKSSQNQLKPRSAKDSGFLETVKRRSSEMSNRRLHRRGKTIWAAMAEEQYSEDYDQVSVFQALYRILFGLVLLPICLLTNWVFLLHFSELTFDQGFWQSSPFWYFTVGALLMMGWFASKIGRNFFLYLYVLGHELTHALFIKCFGGKVLDIHWSTKGGYVTANKTNWFIALSPYFVPFWSVIALVVYLLIGLFQELPAWGTLVFYGVMGATSMFHLGWTLWMIPRDQPDLKENGIFFSLTLIYLGNLLLLITLLCAANPSPLQNFRAFGQTWITTAVIWSDTFFAILKMIFDQMLSRF